MAITSLDALVAAMPGQPFFTSKFFTPQTTGGYTSLIRKTGVPGVGTAPSSGVGGNITTDSEPGAWSFTNPAGGNKTYLSHFAGGANNAGTLYLYDRLWNNSGLSITTVGAQTVNSSTLTRFTDGIGVEAWWEVVTNLGAGTTAPTISYTNTDGTAGRAGATQLLTTSSTADRAYPFSLQAGDIGIKSIESYNNVGSHTSGTITLVLRKRIATLVVNNGGTGDSLDPFEVGMIEIPNDACLEFIWICTTTGVHTLTADHTLVQG